MPKSNNFSFFSFIYIAQNGQLLQIVLKVLESDGIGSLRIGQIPVDRIGSLSSAKFRWIGTEETIRHLSFVSKISEGVSSQLVEWSLGSLEKLSWNLT